MNYIYSIDGTKICSTIEKIIPANNIRQSSS